MPKEIDRQDVSIEAELGKARTLIDVVIKSDISMEGGVWCCDQGLFEVGER